MLEEHKDMIYIIPTNKYEDDIIGVIRKYRTALYDMRDEIYSSSRAMYLRLKDSHKRGRPGFFQLHDVLVNDCINNRNLDEDLTTALYLLKCLAYPLQRKWMYVEEGCLIIDRTQFTNHQHYYIFNTERKISIKGVEFLTWIGRMENDFPHTTITDFYTDYMKAKHNLIPEPIQHLEIEQSDTIIEMMSNLELNQNDYVKLLKYITQQL